jgi:ATP-dependent helicase/nuclease subunit B
VIDQEDFDHVRRFAREKIVEIGQKLVEGEVAVNPYKLKQRTPCIWCAYRPVCQFDPVYDTNGYRILSVVSRDEILDKIRRR